MAISNERLAATLKIDAEVSPEFSTSTRKARRELDGLLDTVERLRQKRVGLTRAAEGERLSRADPDDPITGLRRERLDVQREADAADVNVRVARGAERARKEAARARGEEARESEAAHKRELQRGEEKERAEEEAARKRHGRQARNLEALRREREVAGRTADERALHADLADSRRRLLSADLPPAERAAAQGRYRRLSREVDEAETNRTLREQAQGRQRGRRGGASLRGEAGSEAVLGTGARARGYRAVRQFESVSGITIPGAENAFLASGSRGLFAATALAGGIGAGAIAGGALLYNVNQQVDEFRRYRASANAANVEVEDLAQIAYIARRSGVEQQPEDFAKDYLKDFNEFLGAAFDELRRGGKGPRIESLQRIGITPQELQGISRVDQVSLFSQRLAGVSEAERQFIISEFFAGSDERFNVFLKTGADNLRRFAKEAENARFTDAARNAQYLEGIEQFDRFQLELDQLRDALAVGLLPAITKIVRYINDNFGDRADIITQAETQQREAEQAAFAQGLLIPDTGDPAIAAARRRVSSAVSQEDLLDRFGDNRFFRGLHRLLLDAPLGIGAYSRGLSELGALAQENRPDPSLASIQLQQNFYGQTDPEEAGRAAGRRVGEAINPRFGRAPARR